MQSGENSSLREKLLLFCIVAFIIGVLGASSGSFLFIMLAIGGFGGVVTILLTQGSRDVNVRPNERNHPLNLDETMPPVRVGSSLRDNPIQAPPNVARIEQPITSSKFNPTLNYLGHSQAPLTNEVADLLEVRGHSIYQHAFDAIQAVSGTLDKSQPLPIDMGLIVYRGAEKPAIYRTHDVPDDANTIQPYVQLHVPLPPLIEAALVKVRFEIIDSSEQVLFSNEQTYTLKDDLNLITPPARLPIANLDTNDSWELCMSVGDKLLARHLFEWGDAPAEALVNALEADGEISDEMRNLLEDQAEQHLSLDDLLASDNQKKQQGD